MRFLQKNKNLIGIAKEKPNNYFVKQCYGTGKKNFLLFVDTGKL